MDLNEAFGSAFVFSHAMVTSKPLKLGTSDNTSYSNSDAVSSDTSDKPKRVKSESKPVLSKPEVYVLHVQIGREDCHLLCMFLLIFAVSFILSSR